MSEHMSQDRQDSPAPAGGGGLLTKARGGISAVFRLYTKAQFGDMQQFVDERRNFRIWLKSKLAPRTSDRRESFAEAVARLGLEEADLVERYAVLKRLSWTYGAVAVVAFGLMVTSPFVDRSASQFFVSVGLLSLMGARCLIARFRMDEIRQRRLMSFQEWIGIADKPDTGGDRVVR